MRSLGMAATAHRCLTGGRSGGAAADPLTFLHGVFVQKDVPLTGARLPVEMETPRPLLLALDGLLTHPQEVTAFHPECDVCV